MSNSLGNLSMTQGDNLIQSNNSMFKTIKETQIMDSFLQGEYGSLIKWKALEVLSEGRLSTIYKAIDLEEGRVIIVKRYNCFSGDKDFIAFNVSKSI